MKILRIITSMDPKLGGPCQGIRNSIPAMAELGVQNDVLSFDNPGAEFTLDQGFKIHSIGPAKGPYAYCKGLQNWLLRNLTNYDIIITHGLWLYNSYGTYRIWRNLKSAGKKVPPLYVMPHGMLDPYFQRARERSFKAIRNSVFWHLIENRVVNGTNGVLFTCEEELLLARKTFWAYRPKSELNIGYGIVSPPKFEEAFRQEFIKNCKEVGERPYWLFLSRIHPKKGISLLIEAYLRLREEYLEIPDLVIAGPGLNTPYGQKLQKLGKNVPIYFPGMLQGAAKWGAFYGCQAFILPTHQENFGIAAVEALACGKPVLTTNKMNIWQEIHNGNGGIITEDTEGGIYSMLNTWKTMSEAKQIQMGINAANIYQSSFTVKKAAEKMLASII